MPNSDWRFAMANQFAKLTNVHKFNKFMEHIAHRNPNLPAIGVFSKPSLANRSISREMLYC